MSQFFEIHPDNPQKRLIGQAVNIIQQGGVIVYPTDSCYALGCHLGDKNAMERIARIRRTDAKHNFTLVCRDLSDIASYARVDNSTYRTLKSLTPGAYTFILKATSEVPRRLQNPKRKTIGSDYRWGALRPGTYLCVGFQRIRRNRSHPCRAW